MPLEVNLNFVHSAEIGYGRLGVKLADALTAEGVAVYDHLEGPIPYDGIGAEGRTPGLAGTVLWVCTPPQAYGWWSTQSSSIFTMWEATRIPESFRENLHTFDTILVPSEQNVELFSRYHGDVRLVHLGVDPADWHYTPRPPLGMFFDFLIGGSGARKGTDVAFEAFKRAFPTPKGANGIPRLFMKNHAGEDFRYDDRVKVISGKLEADREIALYEQSHCYLQPSRGEGFGMQPLQAIAQGMPTILTDAHGHEAFAHLGFGIEADLSKSAYFMYGDAGDWWEPRLDELVDQMRWVYDNYEAACEFTKTSAAVVARDFTFANTARGVIDNLDLSAPYVEGGSWLEPDRLKYRIRCKTTRKVDIAGRRMILEAGVDYWDTADTKRILAEAGCLTQDCIDEEDSGLADVQLERMSTRRPELVERAGDHDLTRWHAGV